ncbi:MAG TPA: GntR family transcriptional regulator [Steroidobacteraceae bacterium]|nr:GntR family transcriptional regulator [Steroidobacteraceae bacterium]
MTIDFAPIRQESAYRKVAAALLERITSRTLSEGERLPSENDLARQFGVNRSTVREALRELQSGGLLVRERGSKLMMVTRPARDLVVDGVSRALALHDVSYLDVWESMTLLEPAIAECAARRRYAEDLRIIAAAVAAFAGPRVTAAVAVQRVGDFFLAVGEATHNSALMLAHEPLVQLLQPSLAAMIDKLPQARARIAAAQQNIAAAIVARDAVAAREWMAKHVRDFRRGYSLAGIDLELPVKRGG